MLCTQSVLKQKSVVLHRLSSDCGMLGTQHWTLRLQADVLERPCDTLSVLSCVRLIVLQPLQVSPECAWRRVAMASFGAASALLLLRTTAAAAVVRMHTSNAQFRLPQAAVPAAKLPCMLQGIITFQSTTEVLGSAHQKYYRIL